MKDRTLLKKVWNKEKILLRILHVSKIMACSYLKGGEAKRG
jgi:hypothetical protein